MAGSENDGEPILVRVDLHPGFMNSYCTTCLRTRRFLDRRTHLVCETCGKRLEKAVPARRSAG